MWADEQKSHIRPWLRVETAQDVEDLWLVSQGKCGGRASKDHVLIRRDLSDMHPRMGALHVVTHVVIGQESAEVIVSRHVGRLTGRSWFVSMEYRMRKLAPYIRGWMQYYGISEYYRPIPELDEWLRRRVRMCYLKQWRWKRTRMNNKWLAEHGLVSIKDLWVKTHYPDTPRLSFASLR